MKKKPICTAVVVWALGATILAQPPGPPRPRVPPRDAGSLNEPLAVGSASVSGTIVMAGTGQPARKTRVSLSGSELNGSRSTTTDDQGRFSFTALPAGRYGLSANKPGHLSVTYGQRRPGLQGTQIQLSDGQKFQAQLQIPRGSVITGTVTDENGEPTPNTQVRAMRYVTQNGRRTLQSTASGSTDDRGIYRMFGLQPGEYVVCATPLNTAMTAVDQMQAEVQGLRQALEAAGRTGQTGVAAIQDRLASVESAAGQQSNEETTAGYAPVCYPGTTSAASATAVPVGIAEERYNIDFQLQLVPMARVEGTVINSVGAQLQGIQVTLLDATQNTPSIGQNNSARADSEGRFRINGVAPGQYRLTARAQIGGPPQRGGGPGGPGNFGVNGGRGAGPQNSRPEAITVWGYADVVVDGRNVQNVTLALQNGMSVAGQVTFEGAGTPPTDLTRMRVTVTSAEPGPMSSNGAARLDASGRFIVPSLPPGRYRISTGGANGWFVESAIVGGQDALDFPFEVKPNQNLTGVAITMTDRQTEISGTVTDDQSQPAADYTLVVFPADSRFWNGSMRRIRTIRPGTDGRYTSRNLPPGEYRIGTVLEVEPGAASDPAFLQQLEASALRVTVAAGEKRVQDIRIAPGG
ncbi:MAG: carboxypeptidase-like regulatory domain-containing protein [Vicinamibacterales bacterium]